jgi:hypothetical protein
MTASNFTRCRFQFSLLTLLVLLLAFVSGCSWLESRQREKIAAEAEYQRQSAIADAVEKNHGAVFWKPVSHTEGSHDVWIYEVSFECVGLPNVSKDVSDADVDCLTTLPRLEVLDLKGTSVSNDEVKKLQHALPNCRIDH